MIVLSDKAEELSNLVLSVHCEGSISGRAHFYHRGNVLFSLPLMTSMIDSNNTVKYVLVLELMYMQSIKESLLLSAMVMPPC